MDGNRVWETFKALTDIDSPTFGERELCDALKKRLTALGAEIYEDGAGERVGGNCGNLYAFFKGEGEPLLFSSHMDTVQPSRGKRAVIGSDGLITSEGATVLGADDVSGITVILEAVARLNERGITCRPIELLFPVAEELYCLGSAVAEYGRLRSKTAYVLDLSGEIGHAANAAPTVLQFSVTVTGKAAHAGFAPEEGINAIAAAASAIARIKQGRNGDVTVNVGKITGGEGANIVPPSVTVTGEIRSLRHEAALAEWETVSAVFKEEAEKINAAVKHEHRAQVTAYETPPNGYAVTRFKKACEKTGVTPVINPTYGASDNNHFARNGIEGIVLACSMHKVHSTDEFARLDELEKCVELVMELMGCG